MMKDRITDKWIEQQLKKIQSEELDMNFAEQIIAQMPEVKKKKSILPLLVQQITYIPKYVYGVLALAYVVMLLWTICSEPRIVKYSIPLYSGIMIFVLGLMLLYYMLANRMEIRELELSCKYGYNQILISRLLCFLTVVVIYDAVVAAMLSIKLGFLMNGMNTTILIPMMLGACVALGVGSRMHHRREEGVLVVFLITSYLSQYVFLNIYEKIIRMNWLGVLVCIVLAVVLMGQCRGFVRRSIWYETYSI